MKRRPTRRLSLGLAPGLTPALALCALLSGALPAHAASHPAGSSAEGRNSSDRYGNSDSYGTKASYEPGQNPRTYQAAPRGFEPVFTENVSRHGSRAATDSEDGDLILKLWDRAASEGQLTRAGKEFGPQVRALLSAMAKVGYGNLSGRGRQEIQDTAVRMEKRLPGLFARIAKDGEPIDVVSSGQGRAVDSAGEFATALGKADPALKPLIGPARADEDLLYFHKAAGGAAYRDYIDNDKRLADTLKSVTDQPATHRAAVNVLKKIFKPAFVARISAGEVLGHRQRRRRGRSGLQPLRHRPRDERGEPGRPWMAHGAVHRAARRRLVRVSE
ncbi:histidine-type phosphatase [Streptomyces sp. GTA36]